MSFIGSKNFNLEVARGNVTGMASVNKFGRNTEIDSSVTADIWDNGQTGGTLIWVAPTTARTHNITSTSTSDDGDPAGVGARTVKIWGLTSWSSAEVSETITMNGTSNVATANSYVIIHRMKVLTKGATNINVGTITATAQTDGTVTAQINASKGQTQMSIYGVPSTQKAYMGRLYGNINKGAGAGSGALDMTLLVNSEPDAELLNFGVRHTFGLQAAGTSALTINYYVPKVIEGPAIIKLQAVSSANDIDVSGGYDMILVDN